MHRHDHLEDKSIPIIASSSLIFEQLPMASYTKATKCEKYVFQIILAKVMQMDVIRKITVDVLKVSRFNHGVFVTWIEWMNDVISHIYEEKSPVVVDNA